MKKLLGCLFHQRGDVDQNHSECGTKISSAENIKKKLNPFLRLYNSIIASNKQTSFALFATIIFLQILFCIFSATEKRGYFIDEIYSLGLSNSKDYTFLNHSASSRDTWLNSDYFKQYLTVQNGERFSYTSVYRNQVADVHPPLYYFVLHTICSFFPDSYSKWYGITLNIILFIIIQILLYKTSMLLTKNNITVSAAILIFYGGTMLAIDNVLYIRMYEMLTMFTMVTSLLHLKMFNSKVNFKRCIILFAVTFCGCMTQYYFGILAFFLSAIFCIHLLFCKKIKELFLYAGTMLLSIALFLFTFPAVFEHIFGGRRVGATTLNNALQITQLPEKCFSYMTQFSRMIFTDNLHLAVLTVYALFAIALLMLIILFKRRGKNILTKSFDSDFWFLTISIALTFATIALLAFDTHIRYMFFIHPLMVLLGMIFFTTLFTKIFCKNPQFINFSGHLILLVSICASFNSVFLRKSSMLYNNEYHNMETLKAFSNCRGIFLVKNNSAPALTQECRAVMQIKEVYCTEPSELKNLQKFLVPTTPLVVWIDKDKFWSSGFDSQEVTSKIINSGIYTRMQKLYSYGLVDCYIFK